MTNEEKAKELLGAPIQWTFNYWLDGFSESTQKELREKRNLLIKMAEWKDQQFKEYLEKKIQAIKSMEDIDTILSTDTAVVRTLTEIIRTFWRKVI